jgi:hypothetical protein
MNGIEENLRKKLFIIVGLILGIIVLLVGYSHIENNLSGNDVIGLANSLADRLNVKHNHQLSVKPKGIVETLLLGTDTLPVVISDNNKLLAFVSSKNREVTQLNNPEAMDGVLDKLGPEYRKTLPPFWKKDKPELFMEENQARKILLELANKIGLPSDVEGPEILLNKDYGHWIAKWKRKYNGYTFDKDYVSVSIIAVNGEFDGYSKSYKAQPCPTDVKIQRQQAVEKAFKVFVEYFPKDKWEKNKDKFELISADLRIVKPDEYWRRLTPFGDAESRLAWVVVFDVKKGQETETIGVLNKDKSIINVDAATARILSSEINIVP